MGKIVEKSIIYFDLVTELPDKVNHFLPHEHKKKAKAWAFFKK